MTSSIEDRATQVRKVIDDPLVSNKETLQTIYHWIAYEVASLREDRAINRRAKHGKWMQDQFAVYNARIEMNNL